jgi:glycine/D-amino acid oxidase-like deaminating enzyme
MDLRSGCSYWPIKDGLPASYPALHRDENCEVAIIGGGITGALIAQRLAVGGANCLVLDKRDVASGSTAASTSLLQYEIDVELVDLIERVGESAAVRAYRLGLEAIDRVEDQVKRLGVDCGFVRHPNLYLASRRSHVARLRREHECRKRLGFSVAYLEAEQLSERFPFSRPGGILSDGDAVIDAYLCTYALLADARRAGARIYDRTTVAAIRRQPSGFLLQTDRGQTVSAHRLVFASGYESQQYLTQNVGALHSTFAAVSEPLAPFLQWPDRCMIWETARPYCYLRTTADDRVIIGGEDTPFSTDHRQAGMIRRKTERLQQQFGTMFPGTEFEVA